MGIEEVNRFGAVLRELLHRSLLETALLTVERANGLGQAAREADFVAGLTLDFAPRLHHVLTAVFPKARVSVRGAYRHQPCEVDIGLSSLPVLGDLLVVFGQGGRTGRWRYNSLLLKAVKARKAGYAFPRSEAHQLRLYSDWPSFTCRPGNGGQSATWDIQPKTIHAGAQFLLLDDHPLSGLSGLAGTFPMGCSLPAGKLSADRDLATELTGLLGFRSGRAFEPDPAPSRDDWTKMVWGVLQSAFGAEAYTGKGPVGAIPWGPAGRMDGFAYQAPGLPGPLSPFPVVSSLGGFWEPTKREYGIAGPSVLLVETGE